MPSARTAAPVATNPNALARGHVLRTLAPGRPGTLRWLRQHGELLLCVRHRSDPAGLRRVVTVELVVATIAARGGAHTRTGLLDHARYPVRVAAGEGALIRRLRQQDAQWDAQARLWYVPGRVLRTEGLLDRVAMERRPRPAHGRVGGDRRPR
ncbi:MAG: hypothetical protein KF683_17755 [Rubrivivax sp.]|nr:hypothetical protein [Rubrivivax sp.]